ncbi:MAG: TonB-dependent receptor [Rhodothermales bacterium]
MTARRHALGALIGLAALLGSAVQAQTLTYDDARLRDVIEDVERRTDWRFLYADALVAGKRVGLRTDPGALPDALARAVAPQGIGVETDVERRRILLVPASNPTAVQRDRIVRGRVLDGETGEPLPFATVTWDGGRRGVVADEGGAFVLSLRADDAAPLPALTASFVGYDPETAAPRGDALSFRLRPEAGTYPAVVVNALTFSAPVDTAWAARLRPGLYDAVGEGGGLRALDVLPSVAPSVAFDDGPIVRGSPSDAFEVRLDGVPVYSPRHLFGLVDAFNSDALRAVALYVGVAPARVAVAPGGAVEYVTATGSPRGPSVEFGVSSLAARGAVAVPLRPGRTTVLVGGRTSLLGASPWVGDALVEEGLGAVRRTSPLPVATAEVLSRVVEVQTTSASFWDLHVGGADERAGGGRTAVTVYAGGDDTSLEAQRFFSGEDDGTPPSRRPVATRNRWGSRAASLLDQRPLSPRLVLHSRLGGSAYDARFGQSDFTFNPDRINPLAAFVDTLGYDNELREGIVAQRLDVVLGGGLASGGYSLHLYRQRYEETAANRQVFVADQTATRLDLHAEWSGRVLPALDLAAGLRTHLYSAGGVRLSPRVRARFDLAPGLAVSGAVGRSAQFLHRLTLGDAVGAAAWVLSDDGETVTEADLAEATVDVGAGGVTAQLTGYVKRTRGQWLHIEDRSIRDLANRTVLQFPWLPDVDSRARGLEALVRVPVRPWSLGASAALARVELQHPALGGGEPFAADWDRRLQATFLADGPILPGLWLATAWTVASGAPNPLAERFREADRLDPISRLDLRLTARRRWGGTTASLSLAVRNVLDTDNAVTRESTAVLRRTLTGQTRLGRVPLDVYDAGILPTLDLALRW